MGTICPECGERSNVVGHITVNGLPPVKPDEIIASRLACGHVVGGEGYEELVRVVSGIDVDMVRAIENIKTRARYDKTTDYKAFVEEAKKDVTE